MSTQFRWFNVVFILALLLGFAPIAGSTPRVQAAPEASDLADLEAPPAPEARSLPDPRTIAATTAYTGTATGDARLDLTFDPGGGIGPLYRDVYAITLQPDGKIVIGGSFTTYDGVARNGIARLNADGSLDTSFDSSSGAVYVYAFALQPDGKILIGGNFNEYNGVARNYIARLNADGSLDTSFDPEISVITGSGYEMVRAIALQPDGKILIGGTFLTFGSEVRDYIARLNADGSLDTTFNPDSGLSGDQYHGVFALALQPDGRILVGGYFTTNDGFWDKNDIVRLNTDGSLDTTFNNKLFDSGADGGVGALALQPDGKILIGGTFHTYNGVWREHIARLNADGSLDTTFAPVSGVERFVNALALQPDGKILIGGGLETYNGAVRKNIVRVNADSSLDTTFDPGGGLNTYDLNALALQPDGRIVIGGEFRTYDGYPRSGIARLVGSSKSVTPAFNVPYHSVVTYTLSLHNPLTETDTIVLTDTLPVEVDFVQWLEQPAGATFSADELHWSGEVAADETITFTFQARHVGAYGETVTNIAEWYGVLDGARQAYTAFIVEPPPPLYVVKAVTPTQAAPGDTITYTVRATNSTLVTATGIVLTDTLPTSIENPQVSASVPITARGGTTFVWDVADLVPDASGIITITGQLAADTPTGPLTNTGEIAGQIDGAPRQHSSSAVLDVGGAPPASPKLAIAKTAEEYRNEPPLLVGDRILYTLRVTNTTTGTLTNLTVTDTLPAGVSFFSVPKGSPDPDQTGNPVVWTLASLAANTTETFKVIVKVDGSANPIGENQATATCTEAEAPATATAQVAGDGVQEPGLVITGTLDDGGGSGRRMRQTRAPASALDVGDVLTYTVMVTNSNTTLTMHNLVVTGTLPSGSELVSAMPSSYSGTLTLMWQQAELEPGAAWHGSITVKQTGAALGSMKLQAATDEQSPVEITITSPGGTRVYLPLVMRQ